jgi:AcrR family transcriptional regulator
LAARKYEKKARAATTDETRNRILAASLRLHSDKGFAATSWQDIADAAGVAVGTVYYHFPTMDDLVPACRTLALSINPQPQVTILKGVRGTNKRIEVLVRALVAYYSGTEGGIRNGFRERGQIRVVDRLVSETERNISHLAREAIGPEPTEETARKVEAMLDFRTWDAFHSRGLSQEVIIETVSSLVRALVRNVHR